MPEVNCFSNLTNLTDFILGEKPIRKSGDVCERLNAVFVAGRTNSYYAHCAGPKQENNDFVNFGGEVLGGGKSVSQLRIKDVWRLTAFSLDIRSAIRVKTGLRGPPGWRKTGVRGPYDSMRIWCLAQISRTGSICESTYG